MPVRAESAQLGIVAGAGAGGATAAKHPPKKRCATMACKGVSKYDRSFVRPLRHVAAKGGCPPIGPAKRCLLRAARTLRHGGAGGNGLADRRPEKRCVTTACEVLAKSCRQFVRRAATSRHAQSARPGGFATAEPAVIAATAYRITARKNVASQRLARRWQNLAGSLSGAPPRLGEAWLARLRG